MDIAFVGYWCILGKKNQVGLMPWVAANCISTSVTYWGWELVVELFMIGDKLSVTQLFDKDGGKMKGFDFVCFSLRKVKTERFSLFNVSHCIYHVYYWPNRIVQ